MKRDPTSLDWSTIYDILITECGATEYWRENFIARMKDGCEEYRFSGNLGFGGKLRNNSNGLYVDCYQEDETPDRTAMIAAANERLKGL